MWVGVAFFSVYPVCNWLTSLRGDYFSRYFPGELNVRFIPEFILAYLSMYVLLAIPPFFLQAAELRSLGKQLIIRSGGGTTTVKCGKSKSIAMVRW
jgi:hypothetical protein